MAPALWLERRGEEDASRTRSTYLVFKDGPARAPTRLRLRDAFPVPGPRGRLAPGLHHADQPRRRRRASRDAAGDAGRRRQCRSRRSTAAPGTRGRSCSCSPTENAAAPTYAATPGLPLDGRRTSRARSAAAGTRASRTTPTATSGSSRTSAARRKAGHDGEAAEQLPLPLRADHAGRPAERQAAGAAGARRRRATRSRQAVAGAGQRPGPVALHTYGKTFTTRWVTIHDTPSTATPVQREHAREGAERDAVQAARRTACSVRARSSRSSTSTRPATRTRRAPENGCCGGWGVDLQADAEVDRQPTPARCRSSTSGDAAHAGFDNVAFLSQEPDRLRRGRGRRRCTGSATGSTRLHARRDDGLLEPGEQACALARRGPRRVGDDRRRPTAASARTTTTTRSPAFTSRTAIPATDGILGAKDPHPWQADGDTWRWFYTQQHGDNPTYEVLRIK